MLSPRISWSHPRRGTENRSGGCLCGGVRFEVTGSPLWVAYCHCASCRRHTASPVSCYAGFEPSRVRFLTATPATCKLSPGVARSFCNRCGTPLTYESKRFPGEIHFFTGTFDEAEQLEPNRHVFWHDRQRGFEVHDPLSRYGRNSSRHGARSRSTGCSLYAREIRLEAFWRRPR